MTKIKAVVRLYGYVRPCKSQLRVCEYELYGAAYCGLCHELKRRYGFVGRMLVSYDMTFLYMLLEEEGPPAFCAKRCAASPFRKKHCCESSEALRAAADSTVILAYWKLRDNRSDGSLFSRTAAALALLFVRGKYNRAKKNLPELAAAVEEQMRILAQLEQNCEKSIDRPADCFASVTAKLADLAKGQEKRRVLQTVLYQTGRYIYIADALDDLRDDIKKGTYNPIAARWEVTGGALGEDVKSELDFVLTHTMAVASSSAALLSHNAYTGVTENILNLGLTERIRAIAGNQQGVGERRHPAQIR